ncbi:MAG: HlyD family efflux transporter periplasmic adaptor subunit [Streptosporangiales bacterium]|nr:HlyD family efflux transporter periplasmic adaptor subunit [Streptosporangiales bacterium]
MRRRRLILFTSVAAVAVAAGAVTAATGAADLALGQVGGAEPEPTGSALPKATATVTRGDLVDTETVDGTLGYGDEWQLNNGASGTVTWTRPDGATVERGETLYKVNGDPVTLMYGSMPMYRPLAEGVDNGNDVEQLERNLKALGYGDDLTVDEEFTPVTADAVEDWQDDRGLPETGRVDPSQVIFASGAVRIADTQISEGAPARPGAPALTVTGTERKVDVDLDTDDQDLARKGAKVSVELPDGETVDGKIVEVGSVATAEDSGESGGSSDEGSSSEESTIEVTVALDEPKKAKAFDQAPVSVDMESEHRKDVLSVPVEALLGLREGGYGVQLVRGQNVRIVPVEVGLFAEGRVEVSGQGLAEGDAVGVPPS